MFMNIENICLVILEKVKKEKNRIILGITFFYHIFITIIWDKQRNTTLLINLISCLTLLLFWSFQTQENHHIVELFVPLMVKHTAQNPSCRYKSWRVKLTRNWGIYERLHLPSHVFLCFFFPHDKFRISWLNFRTWFDIHSRHETKKKNYKNRKKRGLYK